MSELIDNFISNIDIHTLPLPYMSEVRYLRDGKEVSLKGKELEHFLTNLSIEDTLSDIRIYLDFNKIYALMLMETQYNWYIVEQELFDCEQI